ncbi:DUF983 domain-containing protein [Maritalea sp.]|uniref:DUF983 domain-containing protein n=1 Tax=Maritalea sp. TaxID=2003361 RepID=UPI0039E5838B
MSIELNAIAKPKRDVWVAIKNGILGRCPKCGKGHLFQGYLKVQDSCANCGEDLYHHRADDAPPYITMAIVGHIIVGIMLHLEMNYEIDPLIHLYWSLPTALFSALLLLRPVKGMVIGLQWAKYMAGFNPNFSKNTDF